MTCNFILTNQRTGGTSLTNYLSKFYEKSYHEPFNKNRVFEEDFIYFKNNNIFRDKFITDVILNNNILIKHCTEIHPPSFNLSLCELLKKNNVNIVFLRRKDESARLQSFHKAITTGFWHPNQKQSTYKIPNFSVNQLKTKSNELIKFNNQLEKKFISIKKIPMIFYEELYDKNKSLNNLRLIFNTFNINYKLNESDIETFINIK